MHHNQASLATSDASWCNNVQTCKTTDLWWLLCNTYFSDSVNHLNLSSVNCIYRICESALVGYCISSLFCKNMYLCSPAGPSCNNLQIGKTSLFCFYPLMPAGIVLKAWAIIQTRGFLQQSHLLFCCWKFVLEYQSFMSIRHIAIDYLNVFKKKFRSTTRKKRFLLFSIFFRMNQQEWIGGGPSVGYWDGAQYAPLGANSRHQ